MRAAVGFDLDMTLIDSRPGIAAAFAELSARTGVAIDTDQVVSRLGPPLRGLRRRDPEMAGSMPAVFALEHPRAAHGDASPGRGGAGFGRARRAARGAR